MTALMAGVKVVGGGRKGKENPKEWLVYLKQRKTEREEDHAGGKNRGRIDRETREDKKG